MSNAIFTYAISTMGCKANVTDSHDLESQLQELGGQAVEENADVFVLNTCTVTDQADRDAEHSLRKSSGKFNVVTGCMAEVDPERALHAIKLKNQSGVVVRNSAKNQLAETVRKWLADRPESASSVVHGERIDWHKRISVMSGAALQAKSEKRTRAFLKVQDGCNQFCSYCIIPHARGRSRSLPVAQILQEINLLVDQGTREIVLTAIHAADYDFEGLSFTDLVEKILQETKVPRLRLTSLDPQEISSRLIDLMKSEPRLCPHFHVSLQSANSRVLSAMKRNYDQKRAEACLNEINQVLPHAFIGMDMIAGFPGETEAEFEDTLAFLQRTPWTRLHVFPYSVRKSTLAARLVEEGGGVSDKVRHERAARLRQLSDLRSTDELKKRIGSVVEVLIESKRVRYKERDCSVGHTRSYLKVLVPGVHTENSLVRTRIIGLGERDNLLGEKL